MKKIVFVIAALIITFKSMQAQDISKNALGVRFGGGNGISIEVSYQLKMKEASRIEMDFGYRSKSSYDAIKLTGIYQWVWNIDGGFNWYAGAGAGLGSSNYKDDSEKNDGLYMNVDGNVGIEYNFDIPLLISLDARPEFGLLGNYEDSFQMGLALGIRYQF